MILVLAQIVSALLSTSLILLQEPVDDSVSYASFFSPKPIKRGWEKITFIITIFVIVAFIFVSFLRLIIEKQ